MHQRIKEIQSDFYKRNEKYHALINRYMDENHYLYDYILDDLLTKIDRENNRKRFLDLGAGNGVYAIRARENGAIACSVDLSIYACESIKKREKGVLAAQGDAEKIPFKDESFDLIFCIQVMEHIPYPEDMIAEVHRVLKNDGLLFLTAPNILPKNSLLRLLAIIRNILLGAECKKIVQPNSALMERWREAERIEDLIDSDLCNKTNVFQAFNLLRASRFKIVYCDTLMHPLKYKPESLRLARLRHKVPLWKYFGGNFKIIAQK